MKVRIKTFEVDVDWYDEDLGTPQQGDPQADRLEASVAEAIQEALASRAANGFSHDLESLVSILPPDTVEAEIVRS